MVDSHVMYPKSAGRPCICLDKSLNNCGGIRVWVRVSSTSWNYSLTHTAERGLVLLLCHIDQTPIAALRFGLCDTCAVKYQAFVYLNHNARATKSVVVTVYERTNIQLEWHCIA